MTEHRTVPTLLVGVAAGAALALTVQRLATDLTATKRRRPGLDPEDDEQTGDAPEAKGAAPVVGGLLGSRSSSECGAAKDGATTLASATRSAFGGDRSPSSSASSSRSASPECSSSSPSPLSGDEPPSAADSWTTVLPRPDLDLALLNDRTLGPSASPEDCIRWAAREFGDRLVMSTSFGMQSAVLLHMATRVVPSIRVIWIDTGYLHRETYLFAQHLAKRLALDLRVYQSDVSPARMEALHGRLWQNDDDVSHRVYGVLRKVEPMHRAVRDLNAHALLSGVRRGQTDHRDTLERVEYHAGQRHYRIHPLLYWTKDDVDAYIAKHKLPYHPLKRKGYVSIGDAHSTNRRSDQLPRKARESPGGVRPNQKGGAQQQTPNDNTTTNAGSSSSSSSTADDRADRATRFGGKRQECGLHTERGDSKELEDLVKRLLEGGGASSRPDAAASPPRAAPRNHHARSRPRSPSGSGEDAADAPTNNNPPADDELGEPPDEPVHGVGQGYELYGRPTCRFCEAAKRVLAARGISFVWATMQRFDHRTGRLEPPRDAEHAFSARSAVVSRADVERRVQHVAPGSPPVETVPQIFVDGEYLGGFADLCVYLDVPKSVMDVALLEIGGAVVQDRDYASTWSLAPNLRRGPASRTDLRTTTWAAGASEKKETGGGGVLPRASASSTSAAAAAAAAAPGDDIARTSPASSSSSGPPSSSPQSSARAEDARSVVGGRRASRTSSDGGGLGSASGRSRSLRDLFQSGASVDTDDDPRRRRGPDDDATTTTTTTTSPTTLGSASSSSSSLCGGGGGHPRAPSSAAAASSSSRPSPPPPPPRGNDVSRGAADAERAPRSAVGGAGPR